MKVTIYGGPRDGEVLTLHDRYRVGDYVNFMAPVNHVAILTRGELDPMEYVEHRAIARPIGRYAMVLAEAVYDDNGMQLHPALIVGWHVICWTDELREAYK